MKSVNIRDVDLFASCFGGNYDLTKMDEELKTKLERFATYLGGADRITITSHFRTPLQNVKCGGSPTSSHLSGRAVDIAVSSGTMRYKMVQAALHVGFKRIGVYDRHLHLDVDYNKPNPVIWLGNSR